MRSQLFSFRRIKISKNMSRMDEDSEEGNSSPLHSVLGEIKQLERHIALADYELRKLPSPPTISISFANQV